MNIFTNKGLFKKLLCIVIAITIFSAVIPTNVSYASVAAKKVGGALLSPIASLLIGLGDAVMDIIHNVVYGMENSIIVVEKKDDKWSFFWTIVNVLVVVVAIVAITWATVGLGTTILGAFGAATTTAGAIVGKMIPFAIKAGLIIGASLTLLSWFGDSVVFPMYYVSPEEMFRGEIPLLDINIFKTQEEVNEEYKEIMDQIASYKKDTEENRSTVNLITDTILEDEGTKSFGTGNYGKTEDLANYANEIYGILKARYGFKTINRYSIKADKIDPFYNEKELLGKCFMEDGHLLGKPELSTYGDSGNLDFISNTSGQFRWWMPEEFNWKSSNEYYRIVWSREWIVNAEDFSETLQLKWQIYRDTITDVMIDNLIYEVKDEKKETFYDDTNGDKSWSWLWNNDLDVIFGDKETYKKQFEEDIRPPYGATVKKESKFVYNTGDEIRFLKIGAIWYYNGNTGNYVEVALTYIEAKCDIEATMVKQSQYDELLTEQQKTKTLGLEIKPLISKWYYAIRNFVLVVMMVVLLYIGIRIMLCGIASEKAKYKNMLTDWFVAICLVFIMHYIMVFAMNLVDAITEIFASLGNGDDPFVNIYEIDEDLKDKIRKELLEKFDIDIQAETDKNGNPQEYLIRNEDGSFAKSENDKNYYLMWNAKNLVGMTRIQAALSGAKTLTYVGYGILYLVLVCYTVFFLFTYMKRALYLAFFTVTAPLVAMTYPIDKLHDGKAQAFNIWFKEYIFNLAIQPVHLLLYTVLVSSAAELSSTNVIYSLVAIGFMMPAEKFIRKMFGFDKAQTPGFLGGAAGAALTMTGLNKLFHRRPSKGGKGDGYTDGEGKSNKEDKIKYKDDSLVDPKLLTGDVGTNTSNQGGIRLNKGVNTKFAAGNKNVRMQAGQRKLQEEANKKSRMQAAQKKSQEDALRKAQEDANKKAEERREKLRKSFIGRQARGIWAGTKTYAGQKFKRAGNYLASGRPIRSIAKTAGGLYLGAAGALLGGTLGIASGDLGKVGQYGATLGAGGYALGARDIKSSPDMEMAYAEYERAQYGSEEEYRKHLLEEQRKEVAENDKNQRKLREYLKLRDDQEAKEYMEEYGECIDAGITDMEDLATIVKLVEDEGWEKNLAITASKYYKKAGGKPKNMGKRDRENIEYQYRNIIDPERKMEDAEAERQVKIMLDKLNLYGKTKDDLTNV